MTTSTGPFIRILETTFSVEDDGAGGSMQVFDELDDDGLAVPSRDEEIMLDDPDIALVDQLCNLLSDEGTTEWVGSWWNCPDWSQDYRTGEYTERSAFPHNIPDDVLDKALSVPF